MDILTITIKDRRKKNQTLKRTETQSEEGAEKGYRKSDERTKLVDPFKGP